LLISERTSRARMMAKVSRNTLANTSPTSRLEGETEVCIVTLREKMLFSSVLEVDQAIDGEDASRPYKEGGDNNRRYERISLDLTIEVRRHEIYHQEHEDWDCAQCNR